MKSTRFRHISIAVVYLLLIPNSSVAVGAAIYSSTKKLMTDKTLRLTPNRPEDREH
ncbi:hypothetical protein BDW75DRAFT_210098 [Aspergillus navahoensis]